MIARSVLVWLVYVTHIMLLVGRMVVEGFFDGMVGVVNFYLMCAVCR